MSVEKSGLGVIEMRRKGTMDGNKAGSVHRLRWEKGLGRVER